MSDFYLHATLFYVKVSDIYLPGPKSSYHPPSRRVESPVSCINTKECERAGWRCSIGNREHVPDVLDVEPQ